MQLGVRLGWGMVGVCCGLFGSSGGGGCIGMIMSCGVGGCVRGGAASDEPSLALCWSEGREERRGSCLSGISNDRPYCVAEAPQRPAIMATSTG